MPSPELSSDIHYQNYGHHGLFPVITLRLAGARLLLASFLVAGCHWPMGGQRQVYILGWVIYKETTNPTRFPITALQAGLCSIGDRGVFVFVRPTFCICPAELLYLSGPVVLYLLCCVAAAARRAGEDIQPCSRSTAIIYYDYYYDSHINRAYNAAYKPGPCFHSSRPHSSLQVNIAFIIHWRPL